MCLVELRFCLALSPVAPWADPQHIDRLEYQTLRMQLPGNICKPKRLSKTMFSWPHSMILRTLSTEHLFVQSNLCFQPLPCASPCSYMAYTLQLFSRLTFIHVTHSVQCLAHNWSIIHMLHWTGDLISSRQEGIKIWKPNEWLKWTELAMGRPVQGYTGPWEWALGERLEGLYSSVVENLTFPKKSGPCPLGAGK